MPTWSCCGNAHCAACSTATGTWAGDNRFHYLGQYQYGVDMPLGYRWYFPGWGRYTTPDPTGQETNHYAYAKDDPINNSDPTGAKGGKSCNAAGIATIFSLLGFAAGIAAAGAIGGALAPVAIQGGIATTGALTGAIVRMKLNHMERVKIIDGKLLGPLIASIVTIVLFIFSFVYLKILVVNILAILALLAMLYTWWAYFKARKIERK